MRIYIINSIKGVKVICPSDAYVENFNIGRYQVKAILLADGYTFHIFKGGVLKAIIGSDDWFISSLDGEGQNLLNRLLKIYGQL